MCLIIASNNGTIPDSGLLKRGYTHNPDGWGLTYLKGKKAKVIKGWDLADLDLALDRIDGNPYVLHFRFATHGKIDQYNTHPFKVADNAYMAHNGVLRIPTPTPNKSDTWHFAEWLRTEGFRADWLDDKRWVAEMGKNIGTGNKLAFLTPRHGVTLVNEDVGKWHGSYWLSNEHCTFAPRYSQHSFGTDKRWEYTLQFEDEDEAVDVVWEDEQECDFCLAKSVCEPTSDGTMLCWECMQYWEEKIGA